MKPVWYRVIALGLLASPLMPQVAEATTSRPRLKTSKTPPVGRAAGAVVARRTMPDAPCYMETRYGFRDLGYLCQPSRIAQVKVVATRRSGNQLIGQVKNETGQTVRYAIVNYLVPVPNSAEMPQAAYTFVAPVILQPGQVGEFVITLTQPSPVQITTVEWEAMPANLAQADEERL